MTGRDAAKCFFFDRDGIVNRSPGAGYVERREDFCLEPLFPKAMRLVADAGYESVVITNQRGVALGRMSEGELQQIHKMLKSELLTRYDLRLLDILYCPHDRDQCDCRKPKPGMFLKAAERHNLDMAASWTVGDSPRDVEAGRRAGCGRTVLVSDSENSEYADWVVPDMSALIRLLKKELEINEH